MDDLPDEIFAKILILVPFKQVMRCATVSKRWDAACRYLIRTRESLIIGHDSYPDEYGIARAWGWHQKRSSLQLSSFSRFPKPLASAMMRTLNQMEDLTQLCFIDVFHDVSPEDISPFVRKFTDQLTMLEIDFAVSMIGADVFPHLIRLRCRYFDAKSSAAFPKLAELIISKLKKDERLPFLRLASLKKLLIVRSYREGDEELVREFLLANADTLTFLKCESSLQFDHAVVFPNLVELDCPDVSIAGGCPFPALTHLSVASWAVTAKFLSSLPADQMLSLDVRVFRDEENVMSAISRMGNMKRLKFRGDQWRDPPNRLSIFDNMYHLQEVELVIGDCSIEQDKMIARLVNQNPMLWHVNIESVALTDASLTSLSQLQHLTDLRISRATNVTTAGVLTLLRGSSRNVISMFYIDVKRLSGCQVENEIKRMCEERRTRFHSMSGHSCHSYQFLDINV